MKWILIVVGVIAGLVALMAIIGALMPKGHTASRSTVINKPPEVLWQTMTDCAAFPQWRTDIKSVEVLPDRDGHRVWREDGKNGKMTLEAIEASPPSRLVLRIADPDLPFGGTWTYELQASGTGSRVTITEDGEVYNPIFRFMGRVFFTQTASIETYLKALGKKYGEDVELSSPS
ncbi:MAG TPA: SRPBCC family protein [Blastocatellia bacterium]|nr:SRPBCC family protein [Blastocatellia bacterium]